jgi:hypothetical protein
MQKGTECINGWELDLTAGSGTATATFHVSNRSLVAANALDRTSDIWGASSYTADEVFIDNGLKLAGIWYCWWKIVLATGGANDGDYVIYHRVNKRR